MESIKVFSPGSITNLSCGYDILGMCLESRGDEIKVSKTNKKVYVKNEEKTVPASGEPRTLKTNRKWINNE